MLELQVALVAKIEFGLSVIDNKNILQPNTKVPVFIVTRFCKINKYRRLLEYD